MKKKVFCLSAVVISQQVIITQFIDIITLE